MKAILIDAENKTVSDIEIEGDQLQGWYKAIKCEMVEIALHLDDHDSIVVDEEGLLKPAEYFFEYQGGHQPFAGNGLIVGCDPEGETVGVKRKADEVRDKIKFLSLAQVKANL